MAKKLTDQELFDMTPLAIACNDTEFIEIMALHTDTKLILHRNYIPLLIASLNDIDPAPPNPGICKPSPACRLCENPGPNCRPLYQSIIQEKAMKDIQPESWQKLLTDSVGPEKAERMQELVDQALANTRTYCASNNYKSKCLGTI